ncbi:unnamed protein product [Leptosia nina]|uniref:Uncharacterized protein n=1 Tax=Leptosia nina TaxID=320188 RepID=A0AAV1JYX6_9NEOP
MNALLSSFNTVETIAPAAGTARTDASIHAERAAGASTPSLLSRGPSLDISDIEKHCARPKPLSDLLRAPNQTQVRRRRFERHSSLITS